jgi:hypothetical protein
VSSYSLRRDGVELVHEGIREYTPTPALDIIKSDFGLTDFKTAQIVKLDRDEKQAGRLQVTLRTENQFAIF